jgi:hypothetical protein
VLPTRVGDKSSPLISRYATRALYHRNGRRIDIHAYIEHILAELNHPTLVSDNTGPRTVQVLRGAPRFGAPSRERKRGDLAESPS